MTTKQLADQVKVNNAATNAQIGKLQQMLERQQLMFEQQQLMLEQLMLRTANEDQELDFQHQELDSIVGILTS